MCDTCNCSREESFTIHTGQPSAHDHGRGKPTAHAHGPHHADADGDGHVHTHDGVHFHSHPHHEPQGQTHSHETVVPVHQAILGRNERRAERNRGHFEARKVLVINLISSPGSGKTTLLEKTIERLKGKCSVAVIVGDLATENDAVRMRGKGAEVIQVTTGTLCHLDAEMIHRAVQTLDLDGIDILFIENVGNLVCPAAFDLGETKRVVLLSVTEGEDKPLKYPPVFKSADTVLLTKTDLVAATGFDQEQALANIRGIAPQARLIEISSRTGENCDVWLQWVEQARVDEFENECSHAVQAHSNPSASPPAQ